MANFLVAFAEALAQAAGPLGAPLTGLLAIYEQQQQDRINEEILETLKDVERRQAKLEAMIMQPLEDSPALREQVGTALRVLLRNLKDEKERREQLKAALLVPSTTDDHLLSLLQPSLSARDLIEAGLLNEEDLHGELCFLWKGKDGNRRFLNNVGRCGFNVNCLQAAQASSDLYWEFIEELRGRGYCDNARLFRCLCGIKKGSELLGNWATAFEELCRLRGS